MREELQKKVDMAIKLIQSASKIASENGCPEIEVCYSSGKDSDVILELTKMANVPYRAIYKNTTIDPPYTIAHAKEMGAEIIRPKKSFRELVIDKGYPSRTRRFCCSILKEYKILDYAIIGVRRAESTKRAKRYTEPELCREYNKKEKLRQYFPILYWEDEDVRDFVMERGIKLHPLYYKEDGSLDVSRRLGCMGCPLMSSRKRKDFFLSHPKIAKAWIKWGGQWIEK